MTSRRPSRRAGGGGGGADLDLFAAERARAEPIVAPPPQSELLDAGGYPGATARSAIAVSTLTETAREVIEGAFIPLWVRGEISDFKSHRNGHWYFCLRDGTAQIRCVVWKGQQRAIPAAPDDGMQVAAFGRLTVYAARGEMQFSVTKMEAEGDGLRRKALEITRMRLEADGLFRPERKRALPRFPRVIAIVTSPDGAALHDIVAVTRRRAANVRLVVVPAAVQGDTAPEELCFALDQINRWGAADLVIVGRGGGSREDLWAFNDERVARAVAACSVPTISAVGHEIDFSMCDLVADFRAPTPSAAAETATRSRAELTEELRTLALRAGNSVRALARERRDRLRHATRDLVTASSATVAFRRTALQSVAGRLHTLSPVATLARGYAVPRDLTGKTLGSVAAFTDDLPFDLVVRDGVVPSRVDRGRETKT